MADELVGAYTVIHHMKITAPICADKWEVQRNAMRDVTLCHRRCREPDRS